MGIFKGDRYIWTAVFMLCLASALAVYSSAGALAYRNNTSTEIYLFKQLFFLGCGFGFMLVLSRFKYGVFAMMANAALIFSLILLGLTFFFGTNINEARRWLTVPGIGITIQPSDFVRLALFVYLARELAVRQTKLPDTPFKRWANLHGPILISCALIAPSNLSNAVIIFGTGMLILVIGKESFARIGFTFLVCLLGAVLLINFGPRRETYKSRVRAFLNKDKIESSENFQSEQAMIAVAGNGLVGKGPGMSSQRNFLPHPYSDFIYAIILEEYGLLGGLLIIGIYFLLLFRCVRIVTLTQGAFGALLAAALSIGLVIQALAHMMVNTGILPVTGITLPLISMGGTNLLLTAFSLGIILSVSKEVEAGLAKGTAQGGLDQEGRDEVLFDPGMPQNPAFHRAATAANGTQGTTVAPEEGRSYVV